MALLQPSKPTSACTIGAECSTVCHFKLATSVEFMFSTFTSIQWQQSYVGEHDNGLKKVPWLLRKMISEGSWVHFRGQACWQTQQACSLWSGTASWFLLCWPLVALVGWTGCALQWKEDAFAALLGKYQWGEEKVLAPFSSSVAVSVHELGLAQHGPRVAFGDLLNPSAKACWVTWEQCSRKLITAAV